MGIDLNCKNINKIKQINKKLYCISLPLNAKDLNFKANNGSGLTNKKAIITNNSERMVINRHLKT
jgi:hypothetical protein